MNATPTPIIATETPLPTPTIVWFPAFGHSHAGSFIHPKPPTPEMRPGLGTTTLTDEFSDPSLWDTATSDQASADIDNNRLNLSAQSKVYMISLRHELTASDYYAEITARPSLCRGDDSYGLLVRANAVSYYRFSLSCNGTVYAERISGSKREVLQTPLPSGDVPSRRTGRSPHWRMGGRRGDAFIPQRALSIQCQQPKLSKRDNWRICELSGRNSRDRVILPPLPSRGGLHTSHNDTHAITANGVKRFACQLLISTTGVVARDPIISWIQ